MKTLFSLFVIGLLLAAIARAQSVPAAWQPGTAYSTGSRVTYEGVTYKCLQAHTAQPEWTPLAEPALWSADAGTAAPTSAAKATAAPPKAREDEEEEEELGNGCGWKGRGTPLNIAPNIDVCLPPVVCTSETCPPSLGDCVDNVCQYKNGYKGLMTMPQAWTTYYCTLSTEGCHGVSQIDFPEINANKISEALNKPWCEGYTGNGSCIGIAASSPMIVGNSQEAVDPATGGPVALWGLGYTEASGLCYSVTGPGGTAIVALTDRCGGYCKCAGSGYQECGPCVSAPDMEPNCACVGTVPGVHDECCGNDCPTTEQACDWCASNNHPHFDFDTGTFNHVCGSAGIAGSCQLTRVQPVACMPPNPAWPPGGNRGKGACPKDSFDCSGIPPSPEQPLIPETSCCCSWGMKPQPDGTCA